MEIGQNSFVYAADGSLLGSIPAEKNRQPVTLPRISKWMRLATIAIEDRRFYEHSGIDLEGIARALAADVRAGRVVEAARRSRSSSSATSTSAVRSRSSELIEACLAVRLNNRRSKEWILENYLNTVYYGNHAYGVQAAAQTYFSPAWRLTLGQAALLAGLDRRRRSTTLNKPSAALRRRDQVLQAMLTNGDITQRQYRAAIAERQLHLRPGRVYTRIGSRTSSASSASS